MAIPFILKQKNTTQLTLLVDVGSSSVGVSLVEIKVGRPVNVVASVREDIPFQSVLSSHRFLWAMNNTLEKTLKTLRTNMKQVVKVNHVFCTLSSPWFILRTRNLLVTRPAEFEVNEKTLSEFIDEDIARLKDELKEFLPSRDIRIIEKKILQMKLNGYDIKNPYKQRTSRMDLLTTVGISSNKVVETIEKKVQHYFHGVEVHFGAFPVAAFSAIRDIFPFERNFLFLDITGEATDVSLVENDMLMETQSFPYGKNYFIREISARLHTVHEEAATLFSMFLRGELAGDSHEKVARVIAQCEKVWLARFDKTATLITKEKYFPQKIFFTVDADILPLFSKLVSTTSSDTMSRESLTVQHLDQLTVSKFVTFASGIIRDPFIIVEALFAKKIVEQHS